MLSGSIDVVTSVDETTGMQPVALRDEPSAYARPGATFQSYGLDANPNTGTASSRRGDISIDIPFHRITYGQFWRKTVTQTFAYHSPLAQETSCARLLPPVRVFESNHIETRRDSRRRGVRPASTPQHRATAAQFLPSTRILPLRAFLALHHASSRAA